MRALPHNQSVVLRNSLEVLIIFLKRREKNAIFEDLKFIFLEEFG